MEVEKNNLKQYIIGVDEAGRGPLAGPVVACAVILDPNQLPIPGLTDSKKLSPTQRDRLCAQITENCLAYGLAWASVEEIDELNILQATMLAMERAIRMIFEGGSPDHTGIWGRREDISVVDIKEILIDGNKCPKMPVQIPMKSIIDGDAIVPSISAASIIAKVYRDSEMCKLNELFPQYGFSKHKGYGTAQHLKALRQHGPCKMHRRSFAPVSELLTDNVLD